MSGAKFMKKTALSILMTVFAACTGSAIALGVVPEKTYKAAAESIQVEVGVSEADYSVATASVRLPDETYDSGALRYHVKMSVEKYNSIFNVDGSVKEANTKTGALILPAYLMGEATELTPSTPSVMDVNTTSAWDPVYKADGSVDYYEVKVCLTGIPQPNHSSKLVVRSYVKDASGNYAYTTQKDSTSISDVALSVYNNANTSDADKDVLKTTYLDKVITYNRNGETVTKTAMYGSTMAALEAESNEFIAWYDANGVEYDFNSTITSGNVTLYGVYEQNIVATAESPTVNMSAYTAGGKYTVANVTMNGANVSSSENPAVLEIPASMGLGDKELTVTLEKADGSTIEIPVSATLLTGVISTAADWLAILPKAGDTGITNGQQHYYKLTNDIDLIGVNDGVTDLTDKTSMEYISAFFTKITDANGNFLDKAGNPITLTKDTRDSEMVGWWPNTGAFKGILDGAGYSVKCASKWHPVGQFGVLNGAYIKDVNFNNTYFYSLSNTASLAYTITNSTLENVSVRISGVHKWGDASGYLTDPAANLGAICSAGCNGNTFKDFMLIANPVWANADNPRVALVFPSIFGDNYEKSAQNTFENSIIYAGGVKEIGHNSSNVVSNEDGLIINLTGGEQSHDYSRWVEKSDRDVLVCSGCGYQGPLYFDKTVSGAAQEIILDEADTHSIGLPGISEYKSVYSIKLGEYELGTDINALTIPQEIIADKTKHGYQTLTLVVDDTLTEDGRHTVTVPVLLITDAIATMKELETAVRYYDTDKTGYYILKNDVAYTENAFAWNQSASVAWSTTKGFIGTLDGRGNTITVNLNDSKYTYGLFGLMNGVVQNVTIEAKNADSTSHTVLARVSSGTFDNVTINIYGGAKGDYGERPADGAIVQTALYNNGTKDKWNKVIINSDVAINKLFGAEVYVQDKASFTDCVLSCPTFTSFYSDTIATALSGWTVNTSTIHEVALDAQDIVVSAPTLDLGEYSDVVISTIATENGAYAFGNNANALTIPEGLPRGDNTLVINAVKGNEHYIITAPVCFVDGIITTMKELETAVRYYGADKTGYYVLGNDITFDASALKGAATSNYNDVGFKGILDGRNHTIHWNMASTALVQYGVFGGLGTGSVLKNLTIEAINYKKTWGACVLAYYSRGSLTNVTINLNGTGTDSVEGGYGMIVGNALYSGPWTNVTINSEIAMGSVFGVGANAGASFSGCTLNAPSYKLFDKTHTTLKGFTINSHIHQYTGVTSSDADYDYMKCQGSDTCGALTFKKSVTAATRYMYLEDATTSLTLDGVSKFTSVSSASIGGTDYAVAVSLSNTELTLTFPETYKADTQKHGEQTLSVVVVDEYGFEHTVSVPVIMVTKKIATREALINLSYAPIAWEVTEGSPSATYAVTQKTEIYGYYLLTASVSLTSSTAASLGNVAACANNTSNWVAPSGDVAQYGFRGTLDGQSKFYIQLAGSQFGAFGIIGDGAVFKNVTIRDAWNVGDTYSSLLARSIHGATFEGVTFTNIYGKADTARTDAQKSVVADKGWLCWDSASNLTFKNCTLTPGDYTIVSLLGEISDINSISVDAATLNSIAAASGKITSIGYDNTTAGAVADGGYTVEELQAMLQAA